MSIQDPLELLSRAERDQVEQILMTFEEGWNSSQLANVIANLSSDLSESMRVATMIELVRVDLQRVWNSGHGRLLESYLTEVTPPVADVLITPQLLVHEYLVRAEAGHEPNPSEYQSRFPELFDMFSQQLQIASAASSGARKTKGPASHETHPQPQRDFEQLPVEFGRYRVLEQLGAGAMGKVYLAHDTRLDRQVALKTPSFRGPQNATLVARFEREARAAAKLQHRNICQVFDVGEINGRHFISMAYIEGRCLSDYISSMKSSNKRASTILIVRLATALGEAHDQNVVHRDLKPGNIMVDQKREPIVMDFGLALQTDTTSRMTHEGTLLGSPAYMSPEQIQGNQDLVGPTTDIYALGVIFYELLTGQLPFQGSSIAELAYKITSTDAPPVDRIRADVAPELAAIVDKMMAKDISQRFQSMAEVAQALRSYLTDPGSDGDNEDASTGGTGRFTMAEPQTASSHTPTDRTQQTQLLESSDYPGDTNVDSTPRPMSDQAGGKGRSKTVALLACGGSAFLLLLFGIVFLTQTPYGTVRIETIGELEGLQVMIDGQTVALNENKKTKAADHRLQLKIGDTHLEFDPQSNQFVLPDQGKERLISVTTGGVRLESNQFTVAREGDTILKIELLPNRPQENSLRTDSIATAGTQSSPSAMRPTEPATDQPNAGDASKETRETFSAIRVTAPGAMNRLAVAPDGKQFAATGNDTPGDILIWDSMTGKQVNRFQVFDSDVSQIAYAAEGKAILVSSGATIQAVNAQSGKSLSTISLPNWVRFASFPNRNWIVCLYYTQPVSKSTKKEDLPPRMLSIWDWEKKEQVLEQAIHSDEQGEAFFPAVSYDGNFVTFGLRHSHFRYEVEETADGVSLNYQTAMEKTSLVRSHLVFSSNKRLAATSRKHRQSLFAVLDIFTGRVLHELDSERASDQGMGCQMAFAPDGKRLVVGDMQGGISVWNAESGKLIKRMYSHASGPAKNGPPAVGVTPDNHVISAGGTHDRTIVIDQLPPL